MDKSLEQFRERLAEISGNPDCLFPDGPTWKPCPKGANINAANTCDFCKADATIALMKEYKMGFVDEDKELLRCGHMSMTMSHGNINPKCPLVKAGWKYVEMI